MAGTYEIPAEGSPNSTEDPKIKTFISSWNGKLNAENDLEDSGIASPNNSAYRTIFSGNTAVRLEVAAATYVLETAVVASGSSTSQTPNVFSFAKADYEVAGKTQKLRIRAQTLTNATKPTIKFTVGLYPVTVAGGANEIAVTLGTVVSGSTIEFNEPAASTVTAKETSDFTIPADGVYALGVVTSAKLTASNFTGIAAQLQTRSV